MKPLFFSHLHAYIRSALLTHHNATHRPEDVPRGTHKIYARMPAIRLPEPELSDATLAEALQKRHSATAGNPDIPVTLKEMGTLFGLALRRRAGSNSRNYPSGGALYPVETYMISTAFESQTPAVFHYNPTDHVLERLWDLPLDFNIKHLAPKPDQLQLSALIVFTSVWHRSSAKYGDITYSHALLEAGHMSQNLLLVGTALGLQMRPYAGFDDTRITGLLDLVEEEEQAIHTVTLCKSA